MLFYAALAGAKRKCLLRLGHTGLYHHPCAIIDRLTLNWRHQDLVSQAGLHLEGRSSLPGDLLTCLELYVGYHLDYIYHMLYKSWLELCQSRTAVWIEPTHFKDLPWVLTHQFDQLAALAFGGAPPVPAGEDGS
jgi:hypothetical protein